MNKSFLIVPEVKRLDLPLFQLKKTICKQRTTLHKKIITDQGIQNPIVTYLYSNHLDSVSPINQFLQIVDSNCYGRTLAPNITDLSFHFLLSYLISCLD